MTAGATKMTAGIVALALVTVLAVSARGQDEPANNLEAVHEKLKTDKKLIVEGYMELTDAEAGRFWPVYERYQRDLARLDARLTDLLESYAADYRNKSLTDEKAKRLLDEWILLEQDEARHRTTYAREVLTVLPPKKAARYLQIENEYRILVRYDLAVTVPLIGQEGHSGS